VWKPLDDQNEVINDLRRNQQRVYVDNLLQWFNPAMQDKEKTTYTLLQRSDAMLYLEQHLDKIESYLKEQKADGVNALHYKNLLLRIKRMREKYESKDD
jgi:hypothetical protein